MIVVSVLLSCATPPADPPKGRRSKVDARYPSAPTFEGGPVHLEAADQDDGVERDGVFLVDGDQELNTIGPDGTYAVRFRLASPMEATPVFARLELPTVPEGGTRLRLRAVVGDDGSAFTTTPPSARRLTTASVDWVIPSPWRDALQAMPDAKDRTDPRCAPILRTTPDLTPLLAELAPGRPSSVVFVVEPVEGGGTFTFVDRQQVELPECVGPLAASLELYPTLRSALVAKEYLARPAPDEALVTLSALVDLEVRSEHRPAGTEVWTASEPETVPAGRPVRLPLRGLVPDSAVDYRVSVRRPATTEWEVGPEHRFHTPRPPGAPFRFTLTSDSHVVNMEHRRAYSHMALFQRTMTRVAQDDPDFHLDLGDTFNGESYRSFDALDQEEMARRFLLVRPYFELVAGDAPTFLALGNHEGEQGWRLAVGDPVPGLSTRLRDALYPNPVPGTFYRANAELDDGVPVANYFAFQWGDALIVVLDPYRYTMKKPHEYGGLPGSHDRWDWTLGEEQVRWLRQTLEESDAAFKFVFSHQVTGGTNDYGRGGSPARRPKDTDNQGTYEWGGRNSDGSEGFGAHRPGWEAPIHQLLRDTHTTAFFHGHDHVFVHEPPVEGVGYLTVPQPGNAEYEEGHAARSGYVKAAKTLDNSGYLRVDVAPGEATVSYVRVWLPGDEQGPEVAYQTKFTDCDHNGVGDLYDIAGGRADADKDGRPDDCRRP